MAYSPSDEHYFPTIKYVRQTGFVRQVGQVQKGKVRFFNKTNQKVRQMDKPEMACTSDRDKIRRMGSIGNAEGIPKMPITALSDARFKS